MNELIQIVENNLKKYTGGQKYFTALDNDIKYNKNIIYTLYYKIIDQKENFNIKFVVSGEFATTWFNMGLPTDVIVIGGLRGKKTLNLSYCQDIIKNNNFVFVDDSFFLGRTRNTIEKEIVRLGGTIKSTYVIYDGSKNKEPKVHSLYRYFDFYDKKGNKL